MTDFPTHPASTEVYVYGSYGTMRVCKYTGLVLEYIADDDEIAAVSDGTYTSVGYYDIFRIDPADLSNDDDTIHGTHHDIIRVGFWTMDGSYEPACEVEDDL